MTYAVEQINNCPSILPDVQLEFIYNDICNDVDAFIGPEGSNCDVEATVAASKNRAMISYGCSDPEVSDKSKWVEKYLPIKMKVYT